VKIHIPSCMFLINNPSASEGAFILWLAGLI
jgi:hypothetical protein